MDASALLEELHRGTLRRETLDPLELAVVEYAEWLAFPTELARLPNAVELVDQRHLRWPPERALRPMWLLRALARDATGLSPDRELVGVVGSVTFSFFGRGMEQRPAEDVYALHAAWELKQLGLLAWDPAPDSAAELEHPSDWMGEALQQVAHAGSLKVSTQLRRGRKELPVLAATRAGRQGWLVVDGDDSTWHPVDEYPAETEPADIAQLHLCHPLLGFTSQPDRKRCLRAASEALPDAVLIERYEAALRLARSAQGAEQEERLSVFGPLGSSLHVYVGALLERGRASDVGLLIDVLVPHWSHALGYTELGKAAHAAGLFERAEALFETLRATYAHAYRSEAMGLLARIWVGQGRGEEAWNLLSDSVRNTQADLPQGLPPGTLEQQVEDLKQLFPERAEAFLRSLP